MASPAPQGRKVDPVQLEVPRHSRVKWAVMALGLMAPVAWKPAAAQHHPPAVAEVECWLGRFEAGPETIEFTWTDGLTFRLGNVVAPVDGEWHETVSTFAVRHRRWCGFVS